MVSSVITRLIVPSNDSSETTATATHPLPALDGSARVRSPPPPRSGVRRIWPRRARLSSAPERIGPRPASWLAARTRPDWSMSWTAYSGGLLATAPVGLAGLKDDKYREACAACAASCESIDARSDEDRMVTNSHPPSASRIAEARANTTAKRRRIDISLRADLG